MTWRVLAGSEIGTAHIQTGRTCEDSCWAQVLQTREGQPLLAIFVADGAGSAARGGEGAELAMSAAAGFIEKKLKHPELGLGDELAVGCVQAGRAAIDSAATAAGLKPRDYACTFLGLLSFALSFACIKNFPTRPMARPYTVCSIFPLEWITVLEM